MGIEPASYLSMFSVQAVLGMEVVLPAPRWPCRFPYDGRVSTTANIIKGSNHGWQERKLDKNLGNERKKKFLCVK